MFLDSLAIAYVGNYGGQLSILHNLVCLVDQGWANLLIVVVVFINRSIPAQTCIKHTHTRNHSPNQFPVLQVQQGNQQVTYGTLEDLILSVNSFRFVFPNFDKFEVFRASEQPQ